MRCWMSDVETPTHLRRGPLAEDRPCGRDSIVPGPARCFRPRSPDRHDVFPVWIPCRERPAMPFLRGNPGGPRNTSRGSACGSLSECARFSRPRACRRDGCCSASGSCGSASACLMGCPFPALQQARTGSCPSRSCMVDDPHLLRPQDPEAGTRGLPESDRGQGGSSGRNAVALTRFPC